MRTTDVGEYTEAADEDAVAKATEVLGSPDALFQVSPHWFRTKLGIGLGLILYGVAANYGWWVHGPGRFGHLQFELLILPPVVGIGLLVFMYKNRGLRVMVYPTGALRVRPDGAESYPWDDVARVRLKTDAAEPVVVRDADGSPLSCWLPASAPTFQVWNAWVEVELADGTTARFSPALTDYPALATRVQVGTFAALWPKTLATLSAGTDVEFGGLTATPAGLRAGKQFLPWADVKEITVSGKTLAVKRAGGWLPWFAKPVAEVPNPHVLFAVADVMRRPPAAPPEAES